MTANLYSALAEHFPADNEAPLLESDLGRYSYRDLECESARYANLFAELGLTPGDRVAAQLDKTPHGLFAYFGAIRAGLVYLPLNTAYKSDEVRYFLEDSGAGALLTTPALLEQNRAIANALTPAVEILTLDASDRGTLREGASAVSERFETVAPPRNGLAAILYTSGTTGKPKGAMITHDNLISNARVLHTVWGFEPGDVMLHILPIFHVHGLFVAIHPALINGSPILFLPRFDVDRIIHELPRATVCMGVPTHYTRLLADQRFDRGLCRNMRLFTSGSAPLLERTFHEFEERTGHTILERYGMTETGMSSSNPLDGARKPGTVGPPLPGVAARVVDGEGAAVAPNVTGHLEVKGPNVFAGYWRNPEKTRDSFTKDGFFMTGDLATIDCDGYLAIVGRDRDLIITGGLNVYPKEVELVIDQIPGVLESAVIGLADADFGEAVTAVVVPEPGSTVNERTIIDATREKLAGFKSPRGVHFIDELPRNSMGKVQKNLLRERFQAGS